jgi:hypothetical protein
MDPQKKIIAIGWSVAALIGLILIIFTRSKHSGENPDVVATPTPSAAADNFTKESIRSDLLGMWQSPSKDETSEWTPDGSLTIRTKQGQTANCQFRVIDATRVQVMRAGASEATAVTWTVAVKGNTLTVTAPNKSDGHATVSKFTRMTVADMKGIAGPASISPAPSVDKNVPRPTPFPQLNNNPAQMQKQNELKKAIVGKWQVPGRKETDEFTDDGELTITNDDGETLKCSYKVVGYNRVFAMPNGTNPMSAPVWTVYVDGDVLTTIQPFKDGPYLEHLVRMNANGKTANVTLPPAPEDGPPLNPSQLVGVHWRSDSDELLFGQGGTFTFGKSQGQWKIAGGEVIATASASIWRFSLSADGKTLFGCWSGHSNQVAMTGTVTLTR